MSKDFQWYLVRDNFLSQNECEEVIEIIDNNRNDSESTQDIELKDKDISFMCEKPQNCNSHKTYGFSCRCIRENFATPTEFTLWAKNELTELKDELTDFLPKH